MTDDKQESNALYKPGSMKYVRLFVREWLYGTIRFDFDAEERGVFADLLAMGAVMRTKGLISSGKGLPYPRRWIAGTLNISEELLERVIQKGIGVDRLLEDEDGIHIINWKTYQSEYDRQKPYRQAKRAGSSGETNRTVNYCDTCHQVMTSCICPGSNTRARQMLDKSEDKE